MRKIFFDGQCVRADILRDPKEAFGDYTIIYYSVDSDETEDEWYRAPICWPFISAARLHARNVMREHNKKPKEKKRWTVRV